MGFRIWRGGVSRGVNGPQNMVFALSAGRLHCVGKVYGSLSGNCPVNGAGDALGCVASDGLNFSCCCSLGAQVLRNLRV